MSRDAIIWGLHVGFRDATIWEYIRTAGILLSWDYIWGLGILLWGATFEGYHYLGITFGVE